MRLIYIAGPYTAAHPVDRHAHVERARAAAREVATAGAMPITPHLLSAGIECAWPEQWWADATLDVLAACDAMVLLPGWQDSRGCVRELAYAEAAGVELKRSYYDQAAANLAAVVAAPKQSSLFA